MAASSAAMTAAIEGARWARSPDRQDCPPRAVSLSDPVTLHHPAAMPPFRTPLSTPVTPSEILALLAELGLEATTESHAPAFTVADSKQITSHIAGAHTKNLFVKDKKGRLFLVVAEHEQAIDLKRLQEAIGASGRLSFGTAEQMMQHLGVTPGSVTALAVVNDRDKAVTVIIDAHLAAQALINCHPLTNTMTTTLTREGFLAFFRATGHEPRLVALPAPTANGPG
jgi:Ala-tRNA(Pro) deacylase